jgi:hypothetical protein
MNSIEPFPVDQLGPVSDAERTALELSWMDPEKALWKYEAPILNFVRAHRAEIMAAAGPTPADDALVRQVKIFVVRRRSVDMPEELRTQMQLMEAEIWHRGARDQAERNRVKEKWTEDHAANWRRWRVLEYLYIVDLCAWRILRILRGVEN